MQQPPSSPPCAFSDLSPAQRLNVPGAPLPSVIRLLALAERVPTAAGEALTLALGHLIDPLLNPPLTERALSLTAKVLDPTPALTTATTAARRHHANLAARILKQREELQSDLSRYKSTLIKQSVRLQYIEIAAHCERTGQLEDAIQALYEALTLSLHASESFGLRLDAARVALTARAPATALPQLFAALGSSTHVILPSATGATDPVPHMRLRTYGGLAHFLSGHLPEACQAVLSASMPRRADPWRHLQPLSIATVTDCSDLVSPFEVAVIATLSALASLTASQLLRVTLGCENMRVFIDAVDGCTEAIRASAACNYAAAAAAVRMVLAAAETDDLLAPGLPAAASAVADAVLLRHASVTSRFHASDVAAFFSGSAKLAAQAAVRLVQEGRLAAIVDEEALVIVRAAQGTAEDAAVCATETAALETLTASAYATITAAAQLNALVAPAEGGRPR
jgi:hypothetical protein